VLAHGRGEDARAWAPVREALDGRARVIAYDRRGYGGSPAPEPYHGTSAAEQGEDLLRVIEAHAAPPVVLAGRDMGALAALWVLLRRPRLVRAAVLEAPPLFALVPEATGPLGAERTALGERLAKAGPRGAMEGWLGHPAPDVDPRAFFADYAGLATLEVSRRELRGIAQPVIVLPGERSEAHVALAAQRLAEVLPAGRLEPDATLGEALTALI
jgi:3-oxoadipate enol-lactonase